MATPEDETRYRDLALKVLALGARIGGPIAGAVGGGLMTGGLGLYAGGAAGGAAGETLAQAIERYLLDERSKFNPKAVAVNAALGGLPMGRLAQGSLLRRAALESAKGAGVGAGSDVALQLAETGKVNPWQTLLSTGGGAVLGGGLGTWAGRQAARQAGQLSLPMEEAVQPLSKRLSDRLYELTGSEVGAVGPGTSKLVAAERASRQRPLPAVSEDLRQPFLEFGGDGTAYVPDPLKLVDLRNRLAAEVPENIDPSQVAMATGQTKGVMDITRVETLKAWKIFDKLKRQLGINKETSILDFGAGETAPGTRRLLGKKFKNVTAYDLSEGVPVEGINYIDPTALNRQYDVVVASNVLNVASTPSALDKVLDQIRDVTRDGGTAILNYPSTPRKMVSSRGFPGKGPDREIHNLMIADEAEEFLRTRFRNVRRIGKAEAIGPGGEVRLDATPDEVNKSIAKAKKEAERIFGKGESPTQTDRREGFYVVSEPIRPTTFQEHFTGFHSQLLDAEQRLAGRLEPYKIKTSSIGSGDPTDWNMSGFKNTKPLGDATSLFLMRNPYIKDSSSLGLARFARMVGLPEGTPLATIRKRMEARRHKLTDRQKIRYKKTNENIKKSSATGDKDLKAFKDVGIVFPEDSEIQNLFLGGVTRNKTGEIVALGGAGFYRQIRAHVEPYFGKDSAEFIQQVAATSPQNELLPNIMRAVETMLASRTRPGKLSSTLGTVFPTRSFGPNILRSSRHAKLALEGSSPDDFLKQLVAAPPPSKKGIKFDEDLTQLSGDKVSSFADDMLQNFINPAREWTDQSSITVDRWMMALYGVDPETALTGSTAGEKIYQYIRKDINEQTKMLSKWLATNHKKAWKNVFNERLTGEDVQAALWAAARPKEEAETFGNLLRKFVNPETGGAVLPFEQRGTPFPKEIKIPKERDWLQYFNQTGNLVNVPGPTGGGRHLAGEIVGGGGPWPESELITAMRLADEVPIGSHRMDDSVIFNLEDDLTGSDKWKVILYPGDAKHGGKEMFVPTKAGVDKVETYRQDTINFFLRGAPELRASRKVAVQAKRASREVGKGKTKRTEQGINLSYVYVTDNIDDAQRVARDFTPVKPKTPTTVTIEHVTDPSKNRTFAFTDPKTQDLVKAHRSIERTPSLRALVYPESLAPRRYNIFE